MGGIVVSAYCDRTGDALWSAIGQLLERFGGAECENYIRRCGYCQLGWFRSSDHFYENKYQDGFILVKINSIAIQ